MKSIYTQKKITSKDNDNCLSKIIRHRKSTTTYSNWSMCKNEHHANTQNERFSVHFFTVGSKKTSRQIYVMHNICISKMNQRMRKLSISSTYNEKLNNDLWGLSDNLHRKSYFHTWLCFALKHICKIDENQKKSRSSQSCQNSALPSDFNTTFLTMPAWRLGDQQPNTSI